MRDFAADGRVVTAVEHEPFEAPRIAGDRIVALEPSRFDTTRLVLLDPAGGRPAPLGLPTTQARGFAVDPSGAAWIANGCVLYAPLAGPPPAEPPPGAGLRAEMLIEGVDATLRGRRLRFRVACVAAPAAGCSGTVLVRGDELPGPGGDTPIRAAAVSACPRERAAAWTSCLRAAASRTCAPRFVASTRRPSPCALAPATAAGTETPVRSSSASGARRAPPSRLARDGQAGVRDGAARASRQERNHSLRLDQWVRPPAVISRTGCRPSKS
jgi:hypothetical protein